MKSTQRELGEINVSDTLDKTRSCTHDVEGGSSNGKAIVEAIAALSDPRIIREAKGDTVYFS